MGMMSRCVKCLSANTKWFYQDDGLKKVCLDCDHIGGPYISRHEESSRNTLESIFDY